MSSNLRAEPVSRKKLDLGTGIKFILRKVLREPINAEIGIAFIPILNGIAAAASDKQIISDAEKLIDMIEKHGNVYLKEEY